MKAIHTGRNDPTCNTRPLLSARQEEALCRRWHEHHDVAAAGRLIGTYLHLVAGMAVAHGGCGVLTQELIGEGYVGLMSAACRYDPACGTTFTVYATWWIQAAIRQRILRASAPAQATAVDDQTITAMPPPYARRNSQSPSVPFLS